MKHTLLIALLLSLLLSTFAACGSKSKKTNTLPENKGDTTTEVKSSGSSTGGTTYGGAMTPKTGTPSKTSGADPCGG